MLNAQVACTQGQLVFFGINGQDHTCRGKAGQYGVLELVGSICERQYGIVAKRGLWS